MTFFVSWGLLLWTINMWSRGAQILGARSPGWLNFVRWHLTFEGPRYGTYFVSPFWHLEFCKGSSIFGKFMDSWFRVSYILPVLNFVIFSVEHQFIYHFIPQSAKLQSISFHCFWSRFCICMWVSLVLCLCDEGL